MGYRGEPGGCGDTLIKLGGALIKLGVAGMIIGGIITIADTWGTVWVFVAILTVLAVAGAAQNQRFFRK